MREKRARDAKQADVACRATKRWSIDQLVSTIGEGAKAGSSDLERQLALDAWIALGRRAGFKMP